MPYAERFTEVTTYASPEDDTSALFVQDIIDRTRDMAIARPVTAPSFKRYEVDDFPESGPAVSPNEFAALSVLRASCEYFQQRSFSRTNDIQVMRHDLQLPANANLDDVVLGFRLFGSRLVSVASTRERDHFGFGRPGNHTMAELVRQKAWDISKPALDISNGELGLHVTRSIVSYMEVYGGGHYDRREYPGILYGTRLAADVYLNALRMTGQQLDKTVKYSVSTPAE